MLSPMKLVPSGAMALSFLFGVAACVGSDPVTTQTDSSVPPTTTEPGKDASIPEDASTPKDAASPPMDAAPDAPPAPPTPPLVSPAVWLDARLIPSATTSLKTWADSTANGANATGQKALSVDRTALAGKPGVLFVGEADQALSIPMNKLPALRTYTTGGFSVFMVASFKDGTQARTAQAVLFERYGNDGATFNPKRFGFQLILDASMTNLTGTLSSYAAAAGSPQVTATATGAAPTKNAPHLFVLTSTAGTVALRVDGREIQKTAGFVENNFSDNGTLPFDIGGYTSTGAAQFGLIGAVGLVAIYTRPLADADVVSGETATKAAWGIP